MNSPNIVNEGMLRDSLEFLVKPTVSIDEYESKISDERVIVVGIFVKEQKPTTDLSNFIDRSRFPILDTDVSPAPTLEGDYVCWVELLRDKEFPNNLVGLLKDVSNIAGILDWQFISPGHQDPKELTVKNLENNILLDPKELLDIPDEDDDNQEDDTNLKEYWLAASTDRYLMEGSCITLFKNTDSISLVIEHRVPGDMAIVTDSGDARMLQRLLGPSYAVYETTDAGFIIEHDGTEIFTRIVA